MEPIDSGDDPNAVGGARRGTTVGERMPQVEHVVLVDEHDVPIGTTEKLEAHRDGGRLHRAFSVFLIDDQGRLLMQRRSGSKYHFPRLWTNTCCSHPRPGEDVADAAHRRLGEELGIDAELTRAFAFTYSARDDVTGLTEREFDHVFVGEFQGPLRPNPLEVESVEWRRPDELMRDSKVRPERYTPWFCEALEELLRRGTLDRWMAPDEPAPEAELHY